MFIQDVFLDDNIRILGPQLPRLQSSWTFKLINILDDELNKSLLTEIQLTISCRSVQHI